MGGRRDANPVQRFGTRLMQVAILTFDGFNELDSFSPTPE